MLCDVSGAPDPGLVGREDLLGVVLGQLGDAEPQGAGIGLVGEPGVGKSAVLQAAEQHARSAGQTVLRARGSPSETHLPYASLHQLVRPTLRRVDVLPVNQREALLACFAMSGGSVDVNTFFASLAVLELLMDAALDRPARAVLDVAAVDDGDGLSTVLAAAEVLYGSPLDRSSVRSAIDQKLLAVSGDRYRVSHPLVGSALRRAMSSQTRHRAHAALAQVLVGQPDRAVWHRAASRGEHHRCRRTDRRRHDHYRLNRAPGPAPDVAIGDVAGGVRRRPGSGCGWPCGGPSGAPGRSAIGRGRW